MTEEKQKKDSKKSTAKNKTKVEHELVPIHERLSDEERKKLFDDNDISVKDLPKIFINDPGIRHLEVKEGDIIKITRNSSTAGKSTFYRGVVSE